MELKQHLCDTLARTRDFFLKDLGYIPNDKFDACPMGKAKSPKEITLECAGLNGILARIIDGEEAKHGSPEERNAWYASFTSVEAVCDEFKKSTNALLAKVEGLSAADLDRMITAPWGQPIPLGAMIAMSISHLSYHDGQLNYIQSVYGDDKFHWME